MDYTESVLEKLAERYGTRPGLWGIEVLNEPMCRDTAIGQIMNVEMLSKIYPPVDREAAKKNENYTLDFLRAFYRRAYTRIRRHMPADKCVVFSDAFELGIWKDFFADPMFENIVLDTHPYLMLAEFSFPERSMENYQGYLKKLGEQLAEVSKDIRLLAGEWVLSNGLITPDTDEEKAGEIYREISAGYMHALKDCDAWCYWSWKLHTDNLRTDAWDACKAVDNRWLVF